MQSGSADLVKSFQIYHMQSRRLDDITYNFLFGSDGNVYVGRGWDIQGEHTEGYNDESICISFIGTYIHEAAPARQICAAHVMSHGRCQIEEDTLSAVWSPYT